jgi:hypothetical protein
MLNVNIRPHRVKRHKIYKSTLIKNLERIRLLMYIYIYIYYKGNNIIIIRREAVEPILHQISNEKILESHRDTRTQFWIQAR